MDQREFTAKMCIMAKHVNFERERENFVLNFVGQEGGIFFAIVLYYRLFYIYLYGIYHFIYICHNFGVEYVLEIFWLYMLE